MSDSVINKGLKLDETRIMELVEKTKEMKKQIAKVVIGQDEVIEQVIFVLLASGHALLEGVPGLAKTLLVKTLAKATHLDFNRIQFTPDLMPTDILGTEIFEEEPGTGKHIFKFNKGPVFTNLLLADEINRTPPKTQAALLEVMQEYRVTYAGSNYELPQPFFILATQNPIEQAGTFPLPEAQLDRFMMYIRLGYPTEENELQVLMNTTGNQMEEPKPAIEGEELIQIQTIVRDIVVSPDVLSFVNQIIRNTRPESSQVKEVIDLVQWGAGTRAGQSLILAAKSKAFLEGRLSILPDDIKAVAYPVLRHRILMNFKAEAEGKEPEFVIDKILDGVNHNFNTL